MRVSHATACLVLLNVTGCIGSSTPVELVGTVVPSQLAADAMSQYDKNGDSAIDAAELKACPALSSGGYDANGDGKVTVDELTSRFEQLFSAGARMVNVYSSVTSGSRPMPGVTVTFEPEAFMGEGFRTATGTTDEGGRTAVAIADSELPEGQRGSPMCQVGIYRVKLSGPGVPASIPDAGFVVDVTTRGGQEATFDISKMK